MRIAQLFLLFATLVLSGCLGTYNTATPTPQDIWEVAVAPSVIGTFESNEVFGLPGLEIAVRRGISEGVDLGLQTNLFGLQVDANFAPILSEDFALSLNPALAIVPMDLSDGFFSSRDSLVSFVRLGILADVLKTNSSILTIGVEPGAGTRIDEMKPLFYTKGLLSARFRVSELLWIRPGVEATMPFVTKEGLFSGAPGILRLSLGFIF